MGGGGGGAGSSPAPIAIRSAARVSGAVGCHVPPTSRYPSVIDHASLIDDYGAGPADLASALATLERTAGVALDLAGLQARLRGTLADDVFQDAAGMIAASGLAHLARVLPSVEPRRLAGRVPARRMLALLTVGDLVALVRPLMPTPLAGGV